MWESAQTLSFGLFLYIGLLARRVESAGVGVGGSPQGEQSALIGTSTCGHSHLCPWPCLGWPQQPLGKLLQPSPAEKEVVSFRGFALGQLPLVRQLYLNL